MTQGPDDDLLILGGAAVLLAAVWWSRRKNITESTAESGDSIMTKIEQDIQDTVETVSRALWAPPAAAAPYLSAIAQAETRYGLPANMLARLLQQESSYRPDVISGKTKSPAGALGIAQFMPATAREMGINPLDPFASIDAAGRYLKRLYDRFGNWSEALAAYNWGQGNVSRKGLARAPAETRNYFSQILNDLGLA